MKAKPIIFSAPMVRALLEGRKIQTRRIVRHSFQYPYVRYLLQDFEGGDYPNPRSNIHWFEGGVGKEWLKSQFFVKCPFGGAGNYLWVRESFGYVSRDECVRPIEECTIEYRADLPQGCDDMPGHWPRDEAIGDIAAPRWSPSIYMPRVASRLTLKITDIRVERLQDISEEDAIAEGVEKALFRGFKIYHKSALPNESYPSAKDSFESLWESIHGKKSWQENPCVWVISFEVIHANVDKILAGEGE